MKNKTYSVKIILIIILLTIFTSLIQFSSSQEPANEEKGIFQRIKLTITESSVYQKALASEKYSILKEGYNKNIKGYFNEKREESKNILGLNVNYITIIYYTFVGFIAGLMLWVLYTILMIFEEIIKNRKNKIEENFEFREGFLPWLNLVAGRIWKVPIIGIFIGCLSAVPYVTAVLKFVTLAFLKPNFFIHSIIIAIVLGIIPSFFNYLQSMRLKAMAQKNVKNIQLSSALGQISQ
jgi:hypothetical protein